MITFYQLLLAHLIADFALQINRVYKLKVERKLGVLIHAAITGLVALLFLTPYLLEIRVYFFAFGLFIGHYGIDAARVVITQNRGRDNLWMFLLDQLCHIILIALVSLGIQMLHPPITQGLEFLCHKVMLLTISGYLFGGFVTVILIHYLMRMLFSDYTNEIFEVKTYGTLERIIIMSLILPREPFYLFIPAILLLRLRFQCFEKRSYIILDVIVSTAVALVCGLWLRCFVLR